jgi:hypothetical protein
LDIRRMKDTALGLAKNGAAATRACPIRFICVDVCAIHAVCWLMNSVPQIGGHLAVVLRHFTKTSRFCSKL